MVDSFFSEKILNTNLILQGLKQLPYCYFYNATFKNLELVFDAELKADFNV